MTITVLDSWIREYLNTKAKPIKIENELSLHSASVESVEEKDSDFIYTIEITTNRIDMVSIIGIARETAAALSRSGVKAKFMKPAFFEPKAPRKNLSLSVKNDPNLCNRILAVILDGVKIKDSPSYVKTRLEAAGVRSLNNVVDITNYVMLEVGHPTHVFDYDRIGSHTMIIRPSKPGEKVITLDNKPYTLTGGDIVIDDGTGRIIDVPGIIGTKNSVVTETTSRVIFFIENNNPDKIRKTSMDLGIQTLAAVINGKSPHVTTAKQALLRGIELFKDLTGARVASRIIDIYPHPYKPRTIHVSKSLIDAYLGTSLTPKYITSLLENLDLTTTFDKEKQRFDVKIPGFRDEDLKIGEDIVEEVARMYGYHNIGESLPVLYEIPSQIGNTIGTRDRFYWQDHLKDALKYRGYIESYTYSLIDAGSLILFGYKLDKSIKISNPLTKDQEYLRPSILPSLLQVIKKNQYAELPLRLFEIAHVYYPPQIPKQLPLQPLRLGLAACGKSLLLIKKDLVALFDGLGITSYTFEQDCVINDPIFKILHPKRRSIIKRGDTLLGIFGEIDFAKREQFGIKDNVVIAEIDFDQLVKTMHVFKRFTEPSGFPPIYEDLTISFTKFKRIGPVIEAIKEQSPLITDVRIHNKYKNNTTFRITYQDPKKTLTSKDIQHIRQSIIHRVESLFQAVVKK